MNVAADSLLSAVRLLQSCRTHHSIRRGQQIHLILFKSGVSTALYYANCLLHMYCRCGSASLTDARRVFDDMPCRNSFTWNTLIDAYVRCCDMGTSLDLFRFMPEKNVFTWNSVITGLARTGDVETASILFDEMPVKDAVALNSVMHGYVRRGMGFEALRVYRNASWSCDNFVVATAVTACSRHLDLCCGKQVHARVVVGNVEIDSVLTSALVHMYCKCGDLDSAVAIFNSMPDPDEFSTSSIILGYSGCGRCNDARMVFDSRRNATVVLWNSMMNCYMLNGREEEALHLFRLLLRRENGVCPDFSTLTSVLNASVGLGVIENGKQVHAQVLKIGVMEDVVVGTALVDFYSKCGIADDACKAFYELKEHDTISLNSMIYVYSNCGRIEEARQVFEMIPNKTLISWNSMIVGYSQNGCANLAIELFHEMHNLGVKMDKVTFSTVLSACAFFSFLSLGEQVFALATVLGLIFDPIICTSLLDLYCKCGIVQDGKRLFDEMTKSDDAPWNSMLMGYAMNGHGIEALAFFDDMRNAGVRLNEVTFIGVLTACCHCGLIGEGEKWFAKMKTDHNVNPSIEHYSCLIDLLVRAGRLNQATDFVDSMPFDADAGILTSLLRGCDAEGDDFLGRKVADRLIEINNDQAGAYVQVSNVYATLGDWKKSEQVRAAMRERCIIKDPGCSWTNT